MLSGTTMAKPDQAGQIDQSLLKMRLTLTMIVAAVICAGCAQQPKQVWIRADGEPATAVAAHQFELDKMMCEGDMQKASMSGVNFCRGVVDCAFEGAARNQQANIVGKGCMAQKGYVSVPEDIAVQKQEEFRAIAKQQQAPVQKQANR
jgi:hypothetical protein